MTHSIGTIDHARCTQQPNTQLSLRTNPTQPTSPKGYVGQATSNQGPVLSIRRNKQNPNHHLWNNNGTWYIHYTICQTGLSGTRRRHSLNTKSAVEARRLRDRLFASLSPSTLFTCFN